MLLDICSDYLKPIEYAVLDKINWIYILADSPRKLAFNFNKQLTTRQALLLANEELQKENILLNQKVNLNTFLSVENERLRRLLLSSKPADYKVMLSEVVTKSYNQYSNRLFVNKGAVDGVELGQPVIGFNGIVGQVVQTFEEMSQVMLITDISHKIPLEILRSGGEVIAEGIGDSIDLKYLPATYDIQEGDVLISSGLGGRFPRGYPVASIKQIMQHPGDAFLDIETEVRENMKDLYYLLILSKDTESK